VQVDAAEAAEAGVVSAGQVRCATGRVTRATTATTARCRASVATTRRRVIRLPAAAAVGPASTDPHASTVRARSHCPITQSANQPHTHTHPFNGPFSGTTRVSRYQKGKTNLDFTEARDSEWQ